MNRWLPSGRMPRVPLEQIDWRIRATVGRPTLERIARELWSAGVAAGRTEGIVGTLLVVLLLAVIVITIILAVRKR